MVATLVRYLFAACENFDSSNLCLLSFESAEIATFSASTFHATALTYTIDTRGMYCLMHHLYNIISWSGREVIGVLGERTKGGGDPAKRHIVWFVPPLFHCVGDGWFVFVSAFLLRLVRVAVVIFALSFAILARFMRAWKASGWTRVGVYLVSPFFISSHHPRFSSVISSDILGGKSRTC